MAIIKQMYQPKKTDDPLLAKLKERDRQRAIKVIAAYNKKYKKIK